MTEPQSIPALQRSCRIHSVYLLQIQSRVNSLFTLPGGALTRHVRMLTRESKINILDLTDHLRATNLQLKAVNGITDTTCDGDG